MCFIHTRIQFKIYFSLKKKNKWIGNWVQEGKVSLPSPGIVDELNTIKIQKGHEGYQEIIISSKTKWEKAYIYIP